MGVDFENRLADRYDQLSERLRRAGDYVARNPVNTATRSLRQIADDSGLAPATFTRLAKSLDFSGFDDLRNALRNKLGHRAMSFAERAEKLQEDYRPTAGFADAHMTACISNLQSLRHDLDYGLMTRAATRLREARQVRVMGALGSNGPIDYLAYLAAYSMGNWSILGRSDSSLGVAVCDMAEEDALVVVTKPPFSSRVWRAVQIAHEKGVYVLVITDTAASPVLKYASASFIVPTESPHFYSSYVATIALMEILIGTMVAQAGESARARIARIENNNRILDEVWDG